MDWVNYSRFSQTGQEAIEKPPASVSGFNGICCLWAAQIIAMTVVALNRLKNIPPTAEEIGGKKVNTRVMGSEMLWSLHEKITVSIHHVIKSLNICL